MKDKLRDLTGLIILISVIYLSLKGMIVWLIPIIRKSLAYTIIGLFLILKVIILILIINAFIDPISYTTMGIIILVGMNIVCTIFIIIGVNLTK
jgi:hypothetical protein